MTVIEATRTDGQTPAARFLAAFNQIELFLGLAASEPDSRRFEAFTKLAHSYSRQGRLTGEQLTALERFAAVRNALAHGPYFDGLHFADPVPQVIAQVERLRDELKHPTLAADLMSSRGHVTMTHSGDPLISVLREIRSHGYSQLPVYQDQAYVGLVTTNGIARWLAAQVTTLTPHDLGSTRVGDVLAYEEEREVALHVSEKITAVEAIHRLTQGGPSGLPVTALIVTKRGRINEEPVALVVAADLPVLTAALATR